MGNMQSFGFGLVASVIGSVVAYFANVPIVGIVIAVLLYFLYFGKKGAHIGYYMVGVFFLSLVAITLFICVFGMALLLLL
jgi:hypothetical protein